MDARDELLTLAEIAIGVAGFSGVIAAFLQRGGLHPLDRGRFVNLFAVAIATLILAFVPFFLSSVFATETDLWRTASGVFVAFWLFNFFFAVVYVIPVLREHFSSAETRWPLAVVMVPGILNLVAQIANVLGFPWSPCAEAYVFGLLTYVYAGASMFVLIILYRPEEAGQ